MNSPNFHKFQETTKRKYENPTITMISRTPIYQITSPSECNQKNQFFGPRRPFQVHDQNQFSPLRFGDYQANKALEGKGKKKISSKQATELNDVDYSITRLKEEYYEPILENNQKENGLSCISPVIFRRHQKRLYMNRSSKGIMYYSQNQYQNKAVSSTAVDQSAGQLDIKLRNLDYQKGFKGKRFLKTQRFSTHTTLGSKEIVESANCNILPSSLHQKKSHCPAFLKLNRQAQQSLSKNIKYEIGRQFNMLFEDLSSYQHQLQRFSKKDFRFVRQLGKGTQGEFYLAQEKTSGLLCGIKRVLKTRVQNPKQQGQFSNEIKIQSSMSDHPFITKIYGIFDDHSAIYLVLEYLCDGSLYDLLQRKGSTSSQSEVASIVWQVCEAIFHLHISGVMHRDIKPENIFVHGTTVKLGDFGSAIGGNSFRKTVAGCLAYISPQQLTESSYDKAIDMWCIGVLTYELLTGNVPYQNQIIQMFQSNNKTIAFPDINLVIQKEKAGIELSAEARDFISGLLEQKPEDRLTIKEALMHPFLTYNSKPECRSGWISKTDNQQNIE